jgi:hypothetical protein
MIRAVFVASKPTNRTLYIPALVSKAKALFYRNDYLGDGRVP